MSITKTSELIGMKKASAAVAFTLKEMRNFAQSGMTTKQLDDFGKNLLVEKPLVLTEMNEIWN